MIQSGTRAVGVRIGLIGVIGLAGALSGCAGKPPSFKVVDVAVTEESPEASVVTFVLEGENTSKDPLPLRQVNYSLSLDGKQVFSGTRQAEITLPAAGGPAQRMALPVVVRTEDTGGQPLGQREYRFSGSVEYIVAGALAEYFFDSGVRRPKTGFGESGKLDFTASAAEK